LSFNYTQKHLPMRTFTFFPILLIFTANSLFAQNLNFIRTYGGQNYDDARSIVATDDGGFVFTGLNKSAADSLGDMYLTKINAAGAVLWERFYGLPKEDGGNFLMKTRDGGFLISGHTAYNYDTACDGYIIKTDSDGREVWRNFVGTAFDDVCNGAVQTADGTYYFTGRVEEQESEKFDVMLCKIEKDGTYNYMKTFAGEEDERGYKIVQAADGYLLIAGFYIDEETEKESFYMIKCDKQGNLIWEYRFKDPDFHTRASGILPQQDGSCIISGGMALNRGQNKFESAFIAKIDQEGNLITFNPILQDKVKSYGLDLCMDGQNRFAMTGMILTNDVPVSQPVVFIVDDDLEILDYKVVSSTKESRAVSIVKIGDQDFLLVGKSKSEAENTDIMISRVRFNFTSTSKIDLLPYSLFPNPMSDYTYLKMENSPRNKKLNLYNIKGELVKTYDFIDSELFLYKEDLSDGMYFFQVNEINGKLIGSGKLIVN